MANLAIKGHPTRGKEVIEILEMLGGVNTHNLYGDENYAYYTIDSDKEIKGGIYIFGDEELSSFTLEEFLEKFPYKVGDKVLYKTYGIYSRIKSMLWNEEKEQVFYRLDSKKLYVASEDELHPCKEETMDKVSKDVFDANAQCCDIMNRLIKEETMEERENSIVVNIEHKQLKVQSLRFDKTQLVINDEYELKQEDNTYYIVHKQFKYPKTYEECCNVLGVNPSFDIRMLEDDESALYFKFIDLVRCRNAYWKIADDWKYDVNKTEDYFYIVNKGGRIVKEHYMTFNHILAFPTAEMRDAFYENFKELINETKELL